MPADWLERHPEWWSLGLSAAAWLLLSGHGPGPALPALCLAPADGIAGRMTGSLRIAWDAGALETSLFRWVAMVLAMVPPLAIPAVRHVAVRSFAVRRRRAIVAFLAGAFAVWTSLGFGALVLIAVLPGGDRPLAGALGFLTAAAWQFAPWKQRALSRCHDILPLAPTGWRADRDCLGYGLAYGRSCFASCGPMMLACALDAHGLAAGLCVQAVGLAERYARRPRHGASASVLATLALIPN